MTMVGLGPYQLMLNAYIYVLIKLISFILLAIHQFHFQFCNELIELTIWPVERPYLFHFAIPFLLLYLSFNMTLCRSILTVKHVCVLACMSCICKYSLIMIFFFFFFFFFFLNVCFLSQLT